MATAKKKSNPAPIPPAPQPPAPTPVLRADIVGTPQYIRTAKDTAAVTAFLADFREYDKRTHAAAESAYRMYATDLHIREGIDNFGNWCSVEFKKGGILHIDGRRAYQLAQVGELLATNGNAPELATLPSRALTAIAQKMPDFEKKGLTAVQVAAALPDFQKAQKIGDSVAAITALAEYGIEGDPRTDTERKEDARAEAEFQWMMRGAMLCKNSVKKAQALAEQFIDTVKHAQEEEAKAKAKRTKSKRSA